MSEKADNDQKSLSKTFRRPWETTAQDRFKNDEHLTPWKKTIK